MSHRQFPERAHGPTSLPFGCERCDDPGQRDRTVEAVKCMRRDVNRWSNDDSPVWRGYVEGSLGATPDTRQTRLPLLVLGSFDFDDLRL